MQKSELLIALQKEILRHDFSYFVDQPPSIAQGGNGVVVPGCSACMKRINTRSQFLDHLAEDAMPALIEKLFGCENGMTSRCGPARKYTQKTNPLTGLASLARTAFDCLVFGFRSLRLFHG